MSRLVMRVAAACLLLLWGGCVLVSPEAKRAYFAPLEAVPGLAKAIASERVVSGRWPRELSEIAEAVKRMEDVTGYLADIHRIEVEELGTGEARYTFTFAGGGSSTLLVRLNFDGTPPR